ncbi:ankyrin repeat protein [Seminavis robusta]|uniref:Ankyrin repeat protein n=1 Tax=Seminavis robusta TaxID=568900 RepID=A0A9N8HZ43_9STRA|nr:ankyrin repeat protein [Seminavis robusta]|eukprot:Sro3211_g345330.1 ankyrin repeat protein (245) ;mRNA; f:5335-6272
MRGMEMDALGTIRHVPMLLEVGIWGVCGRYAHENGCPWDERTSSDAARHGHLGCLKYAHENGCPLDENISLEFWSHLTRHTAKEKLTQDIIDLFLADKTKATSEGLQPQGGAPDHEPGLMDRLAEDFWEFEDDDDDVSEDSLWETMGTGEASDEQGNERTVLSFLAEDIRHLANLHPHAGHAVHLHLLAIFEHSQGIVNPTDSSATKTLCCSGPPFIGRRADRVTYMQVSKNPEQRFASSCSVT